MEAATTWSVGVVGGGCGPGVARWHNSESLHTDSEVIKMGKSCAIISHSLQFQVSMLKL